MDAILKNNFKKIGLSYELVAEIIVPSTTSSVSFNNLNISKDDDYILLSNVLYGSATGVLYIYINGNTTATNYYVQTIRKDNSSISSGRGNSSQYSYAYAGGSNSFSRIQLKLTNNGYFNYQSEDQMAYTQHPSWYNGSPYYGASTFTTSNITSITISGSSANILGTNSRFQLYKRVAPIVFDYTVSGSAITSLDITNLSIDKGSEYMLVSSLPSSSASNAIQLYINDNNTSTNYYHQYLYSVNTSVSAGRSTGAYSLWTDNGGFIITNIKLTNNGYYTWQSNISRSYGDYAWNLNMLNVYGTSTFTASSITKLTISHNTANGIGIGSRFQLIKLK